MASRVLGSKRNALHHRVILLVPAADRTRRTLLGMSAKSRVRPGSGPLSWMTGNRFLTASEPPHDTARSRRSAQRRFGLGEWLQTSAVAGHGAKRAGAHCPHAIAMPLPWTGGTMTPTGISSPALVPLQPMHASPAAWATASSRSAGRRPAMITV